MFNRKLYPRNPVDQASFWSSVTLTILGCVGAFVVYLSGEHGPWYMWLALLALGPFLIVVSYLTQIKPREGEQAQYSAVISDIEAMEAQLANLAEFLRSERDKVKESEAILERLRRETTELEPLVKTQRETVNAILAAHAKTTASRAWKERAVGFMTGIVTSLLASVLFEFFRG